MAAMSATPDQDGYGQDFKQVYPKMPKDISLASNHLHEKLFPRNITTETWRVPDPAFDTTLKNVENLIANEWGKVLAMPLDDTKARYLTISKTIQKASPPLRLVWWRTLDKLQKTPRSNEGFTVTLEEAVAICEKIGKIFTYYFLSHRWESRTNPDPTGRKAKICAKYGETRTATFQEEVFFWIDYGSIDQEGGAPFIASLSLYCSGAQVLMVPFNEEYEERAWCLVERLAYAALACPLQFVCGTEYIAYAEKKNWKQTQSWFTFHQDPKTGQHYSWLRPLADPSLGKLSVEGDRPMLKSLTQVLVRQWSKCWNNGAKWPPKGSLEYCATTGTDPVEWGKTTTNVILISFL